MHSETNELLKQIITRLDNIVCVVGKKKGTGKRERGMGKRDGKGRRGRQTEYMEKQRKVFLGFLAERHGLSGLRRVTLARECWAIHRKEWDAAAVKGIGYSDYRSLARAKLV